MYHGPGQVHHEIGLGPCLRLVGPYRMSDVRAYQSFDLLFCLSCVAAAAPSNPPRTFPIASSPFRRRRVHRYGSGLSISRRRALSLISLFAVPSLTQLKGSFFVEVSVLLLLRTSAGSDMAKRELSNTLKNLKFMQRGAQSEQKSKKEVEEVKPDGNFFSTGTVSRKCVVIMEGDPHPGAVKGRMSFQSFNPLIDKINEEAENLCQSGAATTSSSAQAPSFRENGSSPGGAECLDMDKQPNGANGDLKRKQAEVVGEANYPNKSPKNVHNDTNPSPSNSRSSRKQSKHEKLDWNVLRPSKGQQKKR